MANEFLELGLFLDDDFCLLLAADHLKHKKIKKKVSFSLENYDASRCKSDFRFFKSDIFRLQKALHIPDCMNAPNGTVFRGIEGLCILLRRLAYPNRYVDLYLIFGRSEPELSSIFNTMINFVFDKYDHLLTTLGQWWLDSESLKTYAAAIKSKGSPLEHCIGFIDGTLNKTCRPGKYQRQAYSGHKRSHGLKYQSVVVPNGLIANLYGPEPGKRHDAALLKQSQLCRALDELFGSENFYLYGDSGYPLKKVLITPHLGTRLTPEQQAFNMDMSKVRIAVEWEFGELFEQFAFLSYKYNLKIYLQPVAKYFHVATILKNCQTCLYGCQTSKYFDVAPPTLESYLQNDKYV